MKNSYFKFVSGAALAVAFSLASCHSVYDVTKVEGRMQPIDSVYDVNPDAEAVALLSPYKAKIDSMMYRVVGTAEMSMDRGIPESLLSNLVADVLRGAAVQVLGKPADMGLVNIGGSLCVVTLKGTELNHLFENIAACGGEGVSGVQLHITKDGKLLRATVAGKPVVEDRMYTVATIDYLADGNDGMTALIRAEKRECPQGATLRSLFMDYVERQTAAGKKITSRMEGRITVED